MEKLVIMNSGYARCGKDTLASNIDEYFTKLNFRVKKYSFAYQLKLDLRDFVMDKMNIDTFTEIKKEKDIIRPILISYGNAMRLLTNGTFWWKKIENKINNDINENLFDIAIITDGRFSEYEKDELSFIRNYKNNLLLYIEQDGVGPAHESEASNLPKFRENADFILNWPHFNENIKEKSLKYCEPIFQIIKNKISS